MNAFSELLESVLRPLYPGGLESVLGEILDFAIAIAGADFGSIQLLDPQSGDLEVCAQRGLSQAWVNYWNSTGKGKGACSTALACGERIVVEDVKSSPIFAGTPALAIQLRAGIRGVQSTPLVSRSGKPIGVFSTHYRTPCRPTPHTLALLDMLARQAADTLERTMAEAALARANQRLQDDLAAMARLQELSAQFVREGDIQAFLDRMIEVAIWFSDADFGTVQLVDAKSGHLRLVAHRNLPSWWLDFWATVSHDRGACGSASAKGERVIVEDVESSPIFAGTPALEIQLRAGVRAVQATPLISRAGKLVGVLATHYRTPGRPDQRALSLIDLLARQAADIIAHAQLNEALAQAKSAAEAANQAKSTFLANMSHEIRTPLHVVIGLANLLANDVRDEKAQTRLRQLLDNSEHLLTVINDVLELSKIESQALAIDRFDFVLDGVLAKVRRMLELRAQERGLALDVHLAPDLRELPLRGDAARLAQVLINLCGNAIKFTHRGSVTLTADCLGETADELRIRFAVADTGIGIAADDLARLFQPFEQVDPSPSRRYGGSGLGLAISRHLVRLMGGDIAVASEVGRGSTFSFELLMPYGTAAAGAAAGPALPTPASFLGARVLVAEDHPLSQEILQEMLAELGCLCDIAADGNQAVERARSTAYDIILLDMQMPNLDGLAAARAIRAGHGHAATPIIALTANAFAEDRRRCLDAGMDDHLCKPVTPASLARALAVWLPHAKVAERPRPAAGNDLIRALAQVPGLSVGPSWRRSREHASRYRAHLIRFAESQAPDLTQLRAHLDRGDAAPAQALAHQLRGIAGMLGATRIAGLATEIEQTLRSGGDAAAAQTLAAACAAELDLLAGHLRAIPESLA